MREFVERMTRFAARLGQSIPASHDHWLGVCKGNGNDPFAAQWVTPTLFCRVQSSSIAPSPWQER
jgi:hypothetical protein